MMAGDGPVVVVGGTGMLGGQVVTALVSRGKRVRALVRPASDAAGLERAWAEIARATWPTPSTRPVSTGSASTSAGTGQ
jgi:uncharacterized protein YbjT (DUF2867 family)